ncbi:MAG: tyrosine--tRNA ligase [Candidatus Magasanikbacteria bacterium RIFOXYD2_FULL_39_9]|uniref:Tyrosine--tRNA ligase n=1 Tax=Candidatus Magasanikbacteria bacterium RIFOXYD1_FULL_40_23 TaxID=1798705 RepID=A0A1F6P8N2_9BACT|nr:MAG: tyrosine--tRNA ligase [Candidatus Magasanikbacteria bacterium RIFOXYD1_FULL_40_23]OGH93004.1 MAG: tyrosine--tRNA ligase [Candidatus Magasanikbacteria bacterium RIFOXYD2_FULL_39_9]
MTKINTDIQKIEELLSRGVENTYPKKEFLEARLKSGEQLTFYTGYDPTGASLHIGHGITMLKLRQFQDLGHKIIMLIGDFTGMIGDPTDKTSARQKLTRKQVLENCKNYKKQSEAILNFKGSNKVEVKYNSKWLGKMSFEDVVELSSHFTVQRMMERDMFESRMKEEKPIYLHEFLYPLMQGYDSVAMDVDGEVGGNDQTFNMLAGRTLMKDLKNKEKFVLTTKLLVDASGKKMGKTEGNMVSLSDKPEDMFGKVMSWTDEMMDKGFELCTTLPMNEVKKLEAIMPNPRDRKLKLAYEVVKTFLGEKFAKAAQENFHRVFQEKSKPQEIPELKPSATDIITVLAESGICKSKSEARQVIAQGGVKINDKKVEGIDEQVKSGDVVQKGSRFFVKII